MNVRCGVEKLTQADVRYPSFPLQLKMISHGKFAATWVQYYYSIQSVSTWGYNNILCNRVKYDENNVEQRIIVWLFLIQTQRIRSQIRVKWLHLDQSILTGWRIKVLSIFTGRITTSAIIHQQFRLFYIMIGPFEINQIGHYQCTDLISVNSYHRKKITSNSNHDFSINSLKIQIVKLVSGDNSMLRRNREITARSVLSL